MKSLVFLLVLANLLFYAFAEGHFGRSDNPDASRVDHQLNADRIRLVSRGEAPRKEESKPENGEDSKEIAQRPSEKPAPPVAEAAPALACLAWTNLPPKEADRLAALLAAKFDDFKQTRRPLPAEGGSWWVFIPPQASKADADKKAGQLKAFGVTDYFIVQEAGANRFAISLGVFSSENGAGERLAELRGKGVRSAVVAPRVIKVSPLLLEAQGPSSQEAAVLEAISLAMPELRVKSCR